MSVIDSWPALAEKAGGQLARSGSALPERVVTDSRAVTPGDFFVALKGERQDGHDFLKDVAARGAVGALVDRAVDGLPATFGLVRVTDTLAGLQAWAAAHRKQLNPRIIGITGSNGKTTTKEMIAHLLRAGGKSVYATRGNLNSQVGLPLSLLELRAEHTHAVIEMGASAAGDIARLAAMARPAIGVLTGIGRAHLATFGSLEGVARAKWELIESLGTEGLAFLNIDDERIAARRKSAACSVVTFGQSDGADVRAVNPRQDPHTAFDLVVAGARRTIRLPVPGLFNVTNALAAAAVALWERMNLLDVASAFSSFTAPAQRMQMKRRADGSLFLIDAYNANPDSMAAGLDSFVAAFPHWPRVAVVGSMLELGETAEPEHRALGARLARLPLDAVFFVGPEHAWVRDGYESAGGKAPLTATDERAAVRDALGKVLTPDTSVFFKGSRGARLEEIYEPFLKE